MSRIGRQAIPVPKGVTVSINNGVVAVKGGKGELKVPYNTELTVRQEGEEILVDSPLAGEPFDRNVVLPLRAPFPLPR